MESTNESECSFGQEESSDENVNFAVDEASGSAQAASTFQVLSVEKVVEEMNERIKEANVVLQLPPTIMRVLLNRFRWDKDVLLECYYDGDREKLFRDADVSPASNAKEVGAKSGACKSCLKNASTYEMDCGHRFCTNCLKAYLSGEIRDEMGDRITCPSPNCPQLMDDMKVTELVGDTQLKLKYQKKIADSFVHCDALMTWCPALDCKNAIKVDRADDKRRPVTCTCNHTFCFCGQNWHHPITCEWLEMWNQIVPEEEERLPNFQKCVKCYARIDKSSGRFRCRALYCWTCSKEIDKLNWCYLLLIDDKIQLKSYQDPTRREYLKPCLKRLYLFYWNQYLNHKHSIKFEKELEASVIEKVKDEWGLVISGNLEKAFDILSKSRQILMYTYILAYFLKVAEDRQPSSIDSNHVMLEDNHRDLDKATEELSGYLQEIIGANDFTEETKRKVKDKLEDCERRCKLLENHVEEGFEKEWWGFDYDLIPLLLKPIVNDLAEPRA